MPKNFNVASTNEKKASPIILTSLIGKSRNIALIPDRKALPSPSNKPFNMFCTAVNASPKNLIIFSIIGNISSLIDVKSCL